MAKTDFPRIGDTQKLAPVFTLSAGQMNFVSGTKLLPKVVFCEEAGTLTLTFSDTSTESLIMTEGQVFGLADCTSAVRVSGKYHFMV